ncbi:MAG: stage II sporulation protein P [Desulfotomaculaceae bacterium]|nr:stage II sporulation protein P [Desulfotomaculaceae bacterium]
MKTKNSLFIILGAFILLAGVCLMYSQYNNSSLPAFTSSGIFNRETPDHLTDRYTSIMDEQGNIISMMARMTFSGDELYTAEGSHYRIDQVQGGNATAKFLGMDPQILAYNEFYAGQNVSVTKDLAEKKSSDTIAIYHSHTDESYVPSDGKESIPFKGGIYQVGKSMVDRLQKGGFQVNYDQTPHDPHDNNAYTRSRRTAVELMKTKAAVLFDVHRDGIPDANYYRAKIDGKNVARLRLVVGRENPRMSANMDFAKKMMASANNIHPKVVKEIFVGKGDYNQDLMSTALLIEAGTHTNTKEEAAAGIALLSEAIPAVLGVSPAAPAAPTTQKPAGTTSGSWKALGWILGLTIFGGLGFLLVSSGSLANAKQRLAGFGREFSSFLGPRSAVRKINGESDNTENLGQKYEAKDDLAKETMKDPEDGLKKG